MDRPRLISSRPIDLAERPGFQLGRLFVDPVAHEVRFNEQSQRVEPQPLKVLVALADKQGEVVTRDELIERCWNGRIVGDDVINRAILHLRRIAKASGEFAIETVPKAGYRLSEIGLDARPKKALWIAGPSVAVIGIAIAALLLRNPADQSHPPLSVVEVKPFASSGGGVAADTARASDAIVSDMLANSGLPVLRPDGFGRNAKSADLRLSGQIRAVGNRIEGELQVDDLKHGTLLLSRRFSANRDNASALPEQMGAFAATSLATTGALMAVDRARPGDPRLTGEVLRQWSNMILFEDPTATYQAVERIARQMPNSAVAQLALAMTTSHVLPLLASEDRAAALAKGRSAAARARDLAPSYGDVASPDCTLYPASRMAACETALREAFAVDPDSPFVAAGLRNELVDVGRFREALAYDRLAVAAMPYMAGRLSASMMLLEGQGFRQRAEQQYLRVRRWWPNFEPVFALRVEGMVDRGDIDGAARFLAKMPANFDVIDRSAAALIASDVAAQRVMSVRSHCLSRSLDGLSYFCLVALVKSNDLDGAFTLADRLFPTLVANDPKEEDRLFLKNPGPSGLGVLSAPALTPLRQDPRFLGIAERVGLLRYWRQKHLPDFCTDRPEPICSKIIQARR